MKGSIFFSFCLKTIMTEEERFYCIAVNLLGLKDVRDIIEEIRERIGKEERDIKAKIEQVVALFESKAKQANVHLKLRK